MLGVLIIVGAVTKPRGTQRDSSPDHGLGLVSMLGVEPDDGLVVGLPGQHLAAMLCYLPSAIMGRMKGSRKGTHALYDHGQWAHTARTVSIRSHLMVFRAASTATGLAQKAIGSPAIANMSRSLAPSPRAIVRSRATPRSEAQRRSQVAFAARSMMSPTTRPVR